mgnify:CR=1 FL=1
MHAAVAVYAFRMFHTILKFFTITNPKEISLFSSLFLLLSYASVDTVVSKVKEVPSPLLRVIIF